MTINLGPRWDFATVPHNKLGWELSTSDGAIRLGHYQSGHERDGTDNGLRVKSYRGGGGEVHDIRYSDIVMKYVRRPFDINMLNNGNAGLPPDVGPRKAEAGQTENIPRFHDIHVINLTVTGSPVDGPVLGLPEQMPYAGAGIKRGLYGIPPRAHAG